MMTAIALDTNLNLCAWLALNYEHTTNDSDFVSFTDIYRECGIFFQKMHKVPASKKETTLAVETLFDVEIDFTYQDNCKDGTFRRLRERTCKSDDSDESSTLIVPDGLTISRNESNLLVITRPTSWQIDGTVENISLTFANCVILRVRARYCPLVLDGIPIQKDIDGWALFLNKLKLCEGLGQNECQFSTEHHKEEKWVSLKDKTDRVRIRARKCTVVLSLASSVMYCSACSDLKCQKNAKSPVKRQRKDWNNMNICTLCDVGFSKREYYRKVPLKRDNLEFQDSTLRKIINQCFNIIPNPQACTTCFQLLQQLQTYEEVKAQFLVRLKLRFQNNIKRVRSPSPEEDLVSPKSKKLTSLGHGEKFAHSTEENTPCCQRDTFSCEQRKLTSVGHGGKFAHSTEVNTPGCQRHTVSSEQRKLTAVGHGDKFACSSEENTTGCQRHTFSSEQINTISQSSGENSFSGKREARKDVKRGVTLLSRSQFRKGFRRLFRSPGSCRRGLVKEIGYTLFNEVSTLVKMPMFPLAATGTLQNMEAFSWEEVFKIITERTPVLVEVLTALFCQRKKELLNLDGILEKNKMQIGAVLAIVLFRRSRKFRFLQTLNSIQLRTAGCDSTEVFSRLNRMGLCLSAQAARFAVLNVQSDFVAHLVEAKTRIERQLQAYYSSEETPSYSVDVANQLPRDLFDSAIDEPVIDEPVIDEPVIDEPVIDQPVIDEPVNDEPDPEGSVKKLDDHPGFTMCWNITELTCPKRNQSQDKNVNQLFASAYVAENRVPTLHLENQETRNASDIPLKLFHQTPDDIRSLKEDLKFCVAELLCKYFTFFQKHLQEACDDMNTNRHKYINEMKKKSKLNNMGTLQGNTTEATSIVEDLQKFIPVIEDKPIQTVLYGDNRSCERLNKTHNVGLDPGTSLSTTQEGFEPSPQEFQKRMLLLQITMNEFLSAKSAESRGTLSHMKNQLGLDSIKETTCITQNCFSQPADLLNIATDCYGILLAKKILHFQSIEDKLPQRKVRQLLSKQQNCQKYLNEVCERIVSEFWQESPVLDLVSADRRDDEAHNCTCGEELDEADAVKCGNLSCVNPWLHLECAGVTQRQLDKLGNDKDWFCSEFCRQTSVYKYCCGVDHGNVSMIACENKRCEKKWFHFACVGITEDDVPGEDWFCEVCAKKRAREQKGQKQKPKQEDYLRKYCLALLWRGLNDRVRLKAIRAGNGDKMLMYWRIDMAEFFVRNRSKYFLHGHRLMAGINGWLPERERQDIIWNRTVNYIGGENNNLEMDLVNEYLNREYIADVKRRNGIPCETISGNGAAFRIMKQCLRRIFGEVSNQVDDPLLTMAEEQPDVKDRVLDMVSEYEKDKLFDVTLGRTITGFNDFCYSIKPNKNKMIERLKRLSQELDAKRNIVSE